MSEMECNECTVDPEQMIREKIIKEFAEQDFVRVRRCVNCGFHQKSNAVGWCDRYDEMRFDTDYCSEAKPKEEKK